MDLSNLKPAEGSVRANAKELVEVKDLEKVVLQQEVIKEQNQDLVTQERLDLKVVKCLYKDVYLNLVSQILIV